MIWEVVVALKCQRQVVSQECSPRWNINTALSADLKCCLVGAIKDKFPLFKPVNVGTREIWSLLELFKSWLVRAEKQTYSSGSALLKKKEGKVKTKTTESLPTARLYQVYALVPKWRTSSWQRSTEGKRKSVKYNFINKKRGSGITDTIQGKLCVCTLTLGLLRSEQQKEAHQVLQQQLSKRSKNSI